MMFIHLLISFIINIINMFILKHHEHQGINSVINITLILNIEIIVINISEIMIILHITNILITILIVNRQGSDTLFKDTSPASLKEHRHQLKTAEQQAEADDGQNDLKPTATKSDSSMTSFAEFLDSEEETGVVVEKLNRERASIISSLASLNRSWS